MLKKYDAKDRAWALPEIEAFEKLDASKDYPDDVILFIGSSSIRLWKTLEEVWSLILLFKEVKVERILGTWSFLQNESWLITN